MKRWLTTQLLWEWSQFRDPDTGYALDILTVAVLAVVAEAIIFSQLLIGN